MPPGALTAIDEMYICVAVQVLVVERRVLAPGTLTQVGAPPTPVCRTCPALPIPLPATTILLKVTLEVYVCAAVQLLVELNSALMSVAWRVVLTNWLEPLVFTNWLFVRLLTVMLPAVIP